jgi:uncharacterized membrane protein
MNNNLYALVIIFTSGLIHVAWNARYKSSGNPEQLYIGSRIFNSIYLLPLFIIFYESINLKDLIYVTGTTITHFFYFYFLIGMYKNEEFSKVYPLSRGLGNLLTPIFGTSLINELVSKFSIIGILINLSGLIFLNINTFSNLKRNILNKNKTLNNTGVNYSILTGLMVTSYSIIDKLGVININPIVYFYIYNLGVFVIFNIKFFITKENIYKGLLTKSKIKEYSMVGISDATSYLLILYSLTFVEVSYIAPMRNIGIVFSFIIGYFFLNERMRINRIIGCLLIFSGIMITGIGIK